MAEKDQKPEAENEDAETENTEEGEGADKKKGNKMLIIIVAVAVIVGLLIGGGILFFLTGEEETEAQAADQSPILAEVAFVDVPKISANFMTNAGIGRQVKISVSLELATDVDVPLVKQLMPRIVDDFQTYLRQLRLSDIQGSAGTLKLKEGLLRRAQQSASPVTIQNVLFKEIQIQ